MVILSYVFYSKLLEFVPAGVRKLIDTHDVFSDRFRLYRAHGQANEFFSTSRADEAKALDRADVVLAIQEWDAKHFRSLTSRTVAVVGAPGACEAAAPAGVAVDPAPAVLFVGGPMGINVHGVTWFIERVLPAVRRQVPEAELWLVGGIGDRIPEGPGVRRLGFVDALDQVYRRAAVVVNPQQFGTGLSIKSIEALRHARPLVSTVAGARGLEDGAGLAFRQAASAEEFGEQLVELLRNPAEAAALAARGIAYARAYYERNLEVLARSGAHRPPGRRRTTGSREPLTRRVLHYVDSEVFGGSEEAALHLMASLDRRRWEPVLLHHPDPGVSRLVDGARQAGDPNARGRAGDAGPSSGRRVAAPAARSAPTVPWSSTRI